MDTENKNQIKSYLTFKLGNEEFAAHVSKVLNILEMAPITKVPKAPEYLKGVINLRGAVLPVIDTRIKFGMPETEYTNNTCIIVLDIDVDGESVHVGAIVDSVQAVLEIDNNQIMPLPTLGSRYKSEFIIGMAKVDERFIIILNMDAIFTVDEITSIVDSNQSLDEGTDAQQ
ncbi:MAG: chemotaxis protein CheW [Bacteroidales bacterium]|jgi:purine-binding chemotaxis protein CheW|nr:chemotaxis protein CheW [Bacteroidales bacterium]MBP9028293.1 chemotaxis protein CheW [Bacteroidales bacterium]